MTLEDSIMKSSLQADMEESQLSDTDIDDLDYDVKEAHSASKWVEVEVVCSESFKSAKNI